ncbi:osmoprotectant transport system substrate-binding protein [Alkalibacillus filiformis]|uniref:Osmoprotectant transport system substrate-binding protein n=1 Tax=Alkalibacillus filiformis TaxID=200990 RepID=A0ABU0DTV9_9BACI|nr:glycine betaine ABC transporter substrate-binding protein [Alkalibacillus filiformis]MDQ0351774.1 osmoprotectant transport system substrate-binding protein [Alkalibacillus filiformis]
MKKMLSIIALVTILLLAACGGDNENEITVGAKSFTESLLLSEMTKIVLEDAGYEVDQRSDMGSNVLREAIESGQVDFTWDYTGTGLVTYLDEEPVSTAEEAFEAVREIDADNGITWMNPTEVNNTYTLMVRQSFAETEGVESLSDLAEYVNSGNEPNVAVNDEFSARPDGYGALEEHYDFELPSANVELMDLGLTYAALRDEEVDIAMGFSTDSRIEQFELMNLEDDQDFFPDYTAAAVVRTDVLEANEDLADLTEPMANALDSETMIELNYQVDVEERSVQEVAEEFLIDQGIID